MKLSLNTTWIKTVQARARNAARTTRDAVSKTFKAVRNAPAAARGFLHAALVAPAQNESAAKRIARVSMAMTMVGMAIFTCGAAFAIIGPMGALVALETATAVGFTTVAIGAPLMVAGILQEDRAGPVAYGQPFVPPRRTVMPAPTPALADVPPAAADFDTAAKAGVQADVTPAATAEAPKAKAAPKAKGA